MKRAWRMCRKEDLDLVWRMPTDNASESQRKSDQSDSHNRIAGKNTRYYDRKKKREVRKGWGESVGGLRDPPSSLLFCRLKLDSNCADQRFGNTKDKEFTTLVSPLILAWLRIHECSPMTVSCPYIRRAGYRL
eukprot:749069-Amorphochlora_amoeboformis.AAC.1